MLKQIRVGLLAAALGLTAGCQGGSTGGTGGLNVGPSTKVYDYTAYNGAGQPLVKGVMTMDFKTPTRFTGGWNFRQLRREETIGPQVGRGNLTGQLSRGRLTLTLNSGSEQGTVRLTGSSVGERIDGDWVWHGRSTNALGRGKFLAQARK